MTYVKLLEPAMQQIWAAAMFRALVRTGEYPVRINVSCDVEMLLPVDIIFL